MQSLLLFADVGAVRIVLQCPAKGVQFLHRKMWAEPLKTETKRFLQWWFVVSCRLVSKVWAAATALVAPPPKKGELAVTWSRLLTCGIQGSNCTIHRKKLTCVVCASCASHFVGVIGKSECWTTQVEGSGDIEKCVDLWVVEAEPWRQMRPGDVTTSFANCLFLCCLWKGAEKI